jgi:hypothetical protein
MRGVGPIENNHLGETIMRIAYYSLDEVNRVLLRRWASREGVRVACACVGAIGDSLAIGMIVDFDFIPEPLRKAWLERAMAGGVEGPVLVHGHGLSEVDARHLASRGIDVCKGRLRRRVFQEWIGSMADSNTAAA